MKLTEKDKQTNKQTNKQANNQASKQANKQADGQTNKQTNEAIWDGLRLRASAIWQLSWTNWAPCRPDSKLTARKVDNRGEACSQSQHESQHESTGDRTNSWNHPRETWKNIFCTWKPFIFSWLLQITEMNEPLTMHSSWCWSGAVSALQFNRQHQNIYHMMRGIIEALLPGSHVIGKHLRLEMRLFSQDLCPFITCAALQRGSITCQMSHRPRSTVRCANLRSLKTYQQTLIAMRTNNENNIIK